MIKAAKFVQTDMTDVRHEPSSETKQEEKKIKRSCLDTIYDGQTVTHDVRHGCTIQSPLSSVMTGRSSVM